MLRPYMSAEDPAQQAAFGAVGGLGADQVLRTRPIRAKNVQLLEASRLYYLQETQRETLRTRVTCAEILRLRRRLRTRLLLPADRDTSCVELGVEVVVHLVQGDAPHCGELLDVLHVAAVHLSGLQEEKRQAA